MSRDECQFFVASRGRRHFGSPLCKVAAPTTILLLLAACTTQTASSKPISLFDGHTLAGWTRRGGEASFTVEDNCIVGSSRPNQRNSFLCTDDEYANFILELDFKIDPRANSGIQIRSESRPDYQNGRVHGYQVEIDPSDRAWTGGLYDEGRRGWLVDLKNNPEAQFAFRQNEWNHFRIEANGDHIRTELNGVPAAELHDSMTPRGFIALQVHDVGDRKEPLEVRWRNIVLTKLP